MNLETAKKLLETERRNVTALLEHLDHDRAAESLGVSELGDRSDPTEPLVAEQENDAVAESLHLRLESITRAEDRLADGTYGRSVRSGLVIPEERLRADPTAELTVEEASEG